MDYDWLLWFTAVYKIFLILLNKLNAAQGDVLRSNSFQLMYNTDE